MATWSIAIGYLVFITAIIFATYYYFKYKKIFLIVLIASLATYVFSVFYAWDVFQPDRNIILIMLIISTVIMVFLAKYFSQFKLKPSKAHTSLKEKD